MEIPERKMKIEYDCPPNWEMDKQIRKIVENFGWEWIGQGVDLINDVRDMTFKKLGEYKVSYAPGVGIEENTL